MRSPKTFLSALWEGCVLLQEGPQEKSTCPAQLTCIANSPAVQWGKRSGCQVALSSCCRKNSMNTQWHEPSFRPRCSISCIKPPCTHQKAIFFINWFFLVMHDSRIHFDIITKTWNIICSNSAPSISRFPPLLPLSVPFPLLYWSTVFIVFFLNSVLWMHIMVEFTVVHSHMYIGRLG